MIIGIRCIEHCAHPRIISIEISVCGPFARKAASTKERDGTRESGAALGNDFGYTADPEELTTDSAVMNYSHRNAELIAYNATVYVMRFREFADMYRRNAIYRLISKAIPARC